VSGISAGDSRQLSLAAAFPALAQMEREHGSLVRALIAQRPARPTLRSFAGGMGVVTEALAARLGPALRCDARVTSVTPDGGAWRVRLASGESLGFDRVALGVAAHQAAELARGFDDALAARLAEIPFAGLAVVILAFREADLPRPLDGYGYLVTRDEGMDTLGVVWESSLFPDRSPSGVALLRVMLGGARHPEIADLPEADLLERARRELERVMGIHAAPARVWTRRWPRAIAQYTTGHLARVARARERARVSGLELFGTSYDGISFTAAIASARCAADRLLGARGGSGVASAAAERVA
jgi:oxygen-dependent protoporphyrinogen oxidase